MRIPRASLERLPVAALFQPEVTAAIFRGSSIPVRTVFRAVRAIAAL